MFACCQAQHVPFTLTPSSRFTEARRGEVPAQGVTCSVPFLLCSEKHARPGPQLRRKRVSGFSVLFLCGFWFPTTSFSLGMVLRAQLGFS